MPSGADSQLEMMGFTPGTMLGRWWKLGLKMSLGSALVSLALTIGTGRPLCAVMMVLSCQPSDRRLGRAPRHRVGERGGEALTRVEV